MRLLAFITATGVSTQALAAAKEGAVEVGSASPSLTGWLAVSGVLMIVALIAAQYAVLRRPRP